MTEPQSRLSAALADRYRIERELGAGGMATVYLAEDLKHHRKVAVKVLRPELAATMGADRFAREIEVAARLQHPHILGLLDSGEAGGFFYYVMPYVDGETLRDRLARTGELPIHEAVRLFSEVADALAVAHKAGVVHRDIKPENILLSGRHAMVMDFGVAKAVTEATGRQQLTTAGVALGTPAYMAPEQATADPQLDGRVDIYAAGVLAYEMLTGQPPFHGLNPQQTLAAHVTQTPVAVGQRRTGLSPALETVVMRCLAKRPADRFQTADELVAALDPLATPSGGMTPHATLPYQQAAQRPRSRRGAKLGAGAVALGLMVWAGWRTFGPKPLALEVANIRQVSREAEAEIHVALSPDGREVAYESGYPGYTHVVVRDVSGGRPLSLTGDWGGAQTLPAWMPDGRSIVFSNVRATADHAAGRWKLPRLGGQAVGLDSTDGMELNRGLTIVARGDTAFARSADGRETMLRAGAGEVHSPATRMDGKALAYVVGNPRSLLDWGNVAPSEIWVWPVGGRPVLVTDSTSLNMSPAWLPDGTLLFVSNRDGARDLYAVRLDRSGAPRAPPVRLTTGLGAYTVSVADDGRTAAYDRFVVRRNLYTIPIPRSGTVSQRAARALTTGNQTIENPDLSSDGKWLVFDSNLEQGNQDLFVMAAAGGEARRITKSPANDMSPDFSPDGREITFHSIRGAYRQIFVIRTDGSGEQQLTEGEEQLYNPAYSPDGLHIAYATSTSTVSLLSRPDPGGAWRATGRLPIEPGYGPRWSPDGTSLVFDIRRGGDGIGVFPLGGAAPRMVISGGTAGLHSLRWPDWSADGRTIYFRAFGPDGIEGVYEIAALGGAPRLLVRFDDPSMPVFGGAVLAGNGLFYLVIAEIESDIYVVNLVRK